MASWSLTRLESAPIPAKHLSVDIEPAHFASGWCPFLPPQLLGMLPAAAMKLFVECHNALLHAFTLTLMVRGMRNTSVGFPLLRSYNHTRVVATSPSLHWCCETPLLQTKQKKSRLFNNNTEDYGPHASYHTKKTYPPTNLNNKNNISMLS
ncbi:unnamed protein product [Trypanosoma congolense IL3000]|uniref:WGS project CAEQ00000000 data, annotated contig 76 n=1 Tax=Trypanosoma congolense (strain IL3000) TaxID=1068625 RepID=F9WIC1_TRYCI|nr:unnamed protein product [Trypanosoma congolense IL3000]